MPMVYPKSFPSPQIHTQITRVFNSMERIYGSAEYSEKFGPSSMQPKWFAH